jgi:hypothetical protein
VWAGGNPPLDVEGFRSDGSPVMRAYQYFWRNGHVIGRARAGTMGFDSRPGHNHWHFEQFARYTPLGSAKNLAVRSHKAGFCIAPSDPVNLLAPHAVWPPPSTGFGDFTCGSRARARPGLPPRHLEHGPPPERKKRTSNAAARSRKTMLSTVV